MVDPTRIPLHLIVGQALEVYTSSEETEKWMGIHLVEGCFQSLNSYGGCASMTECLQSDTGVLMRVDGEATGHNVGPRITELLLYATMSLDKGQEQRGIMTPPRSSSPLPEETQLHAGTARIYALPLSSELCYNPATRLPPSPPQEGPEGPDENHAQFLPPIDFSSISQSRKRQRLDSLFNDATQQTKRAKRHGGGTVAKVMAGIDNRPNSRGAKTSTDHITQSEMLVRKRPRPANASLSRAHSIGSLRDLEDVRPVSRGGSVALIKRSSLHHVASASGLPSNSLGSELVSDIEQQNKNTLSRIVMAGMRMYGLQQRKKLDRSRSVSAIALDASEEVAQQGEDGFKIVYHQTYKAAAFVFRKHMATASLAQDALRDTVDHLLAMFCSDPLVAKQQDSGVPQSSLGMEGGNVFDSPSNIAGLVNMTPVRMKGTANNG